LLEKVWCSPNAELIQIFDFGLNSALGGNGYMLFFNGILVEKPDKVREIGPSKYTLLDGRILRL